MSTLREIQKEKEKTENKKENETTPQRGWTHLNSFHLIRLSFENHGRSKKRKTEGKTKTKGKQKEKNKRENKRENNKKKENETKR